MSDHAPGQKTGNTTLEDAAHRRSPITFITVYAVATPSAQAMNHPQGRRAKPGAVEKEAPAGRRLFVLGLGALGVVYGDIGTSPLYALRACFYGGSPISASPANVLGVLSLIFWALIVIISLKYLLLVMRAANRGAGGILALLALLDPWEVARWSHLVLVLSVVFGAALLYGDGMITPAISVLSAVEGLKVAAPALAPFVVPLTIVILIVLFTFQKRGTAGVGAVFGPIMLLWFLLLAVLGIRGILIDPQVLAAVDPSNAFGFFQRNGLAGFLVLGGVFLVVTGGEALYADMGHFGRTPIQLGWFSLVLPALLLNYFGQGAVVLTHPEEAIHPFYNLVPAWGVYPMVALATAVTVIASQAVISGAFSLTRQAVLLGYSPRIDIIQTSSEEIGQIYIPNVNWALMVATTLIVLGFGSSENLTAAYGMAVSTTMVITTGLVFLVMSRRWNWPAPVALTIATLFVAVDLAFFGANLFKFDDGGWLPISVGLGALFLMATWRRGRELLMERIQARSTPLDALVADITQHGLTRVPGTAVFLTAPGEGAPGGLLHHIKLNQMLHETVILLTIVTEEQPRVSAARRLQAEQRGAGFHRLHVRYGFMQTPNVPVAIRMCRDFNLIDDIDPDNVAYYLDHATLVPTADLHGMAMWRKRLFAFMSRNASRAGDFYQLPPGRSIELGLQIEL